MLTQSGMGGMSEMGLFYDHCLQTLYPPGSCGFFCNEHTYACYVTEIGESCCDEQGQNCPASQDVPVTCPVGCAIVFPEFLETCRDHVRGQTELDEADFEGFESLCLNQDGLALVEYAMGLQADGCILDLTGGGGAGGRRMQAGGSYMTQYLSASEPTCLWDELDDLASDVDMICCGPTGAQCTAGANGIIAQPTTCNPACAVAMHSFVQVCGPTIDTILGGDSRSTGINGFEQRCLSEADPHFFLDAIMNADCTNAENKGR